MNFLKYIKTTILFILIFLLGTQTTYAKRELILPQNQVVFSVEQTPKVSTLKKEVQPNVAYIEKYRNKDMKSLSKQIEMFHPLG